MPDLPRLASGIDETARSWREPDYPARVDAVKATLAAPNTFTDEAIAFAVNQQMSLLTEEALHRWAPDPRSATSLAVGVLNAGNVPLVDLQDFVAVLLSGHRYLGSVSSRSPALLPAFATDLSSRVRGLSIEFLNADAIFERAHAIIATGSDRTAEQIAARCEESGISAGRRLLRGHRFSVAVTDGRETPDELEGLAEDALLHEGYGCRNVAVVWAPAESSPDALLDAFARFRGVFPAHPDTPGRLKMQQAFLEAVNSPHAHGENLEFLLSRGEPEPQQPGHVRWSEYSNLDEVVQWLARNRDAIQIVVMREEMCNRLGGNLPTCAFGDAQRPPLDWRADGRDVMAFLSDLK